jgi:hypothetical protein
MTQQIHLYERLSHKYRDGWRDLDDEQYVGTAKVLAYRRVSDEGIDGNTYATRVVAPSALRGVDLSNAIADTLSGSRCRHEHDCCGCPSTYADVRRVSRREYAVSLHTTYNV